MFLTIPTYLGHKIKNSKNLDLVKVIGEIGKIFPWLFRSLAMSPNMQHAFCKYIKNKCIFCSYYSTLDITPHLTWYFPIKVVRYCWKLVFFPQILDSYGTLGGCAECRVSFETSFDSKQPKLEPKLVSALSETKRLFRLFRFYTETESFDRRVH